MTIPHDAPDELVSALSAVVSSLVVVERAINGALAVREALLALAGRIADDMARAGDHPDRGELAHRAVAAEVAAALRMSDRSVERRMAGAAALSGRFPEVLAAQAAGTVSAAHAQVIVDAGSFLVDDGARRAYAAAVLARAEEETPGRLRPIARALAEVHQKRSFQERHQEARSRRRVWVTPGEDGMAELGAILPLTLAAGIHDRLSQMAHAVKRAQSADGAAVRSAAGSDVAMEERDRQGGVDAAHREHQSADERSMDELRADLLSDLLLTGEPRAHSCPESSLAAITARVSVTVPVQMLLAVPASEGGPTSVFSGVDSASDSASASASASDPVSHAGAGAGAGAGVGDGVESFVGAADGRVRARSGGPSRARPEGPPNAPTGSPPPTHPETPSPARPAGRSPAGPEDRQPASRGEPAVGWRAPTPAELEGWSPVDPVTARMLAGSVPGWDRILTHPITGAVLAVDRYRPGEDLRRHLRARDRRCRFPGCGLHVRVCDLDHTQDAAAGGPTEDGNLAALCRRHHVMKHHTSWSVSQGVGGVLQWVSPTGRHYADRPPPVPTVRFQSESFSGTESPEAAASAGMA